MLFKALLYLKYFAITVNAYLSLGCDSCSKGQSIEKVSFKACIDSFIKEASL